MAACHARPRDALGEEVVLSLHPLKSLPKEALFVFLWGYYCVLGSGLVHAVWSLWAKQSRSRVAFLWSFQIVAVITYLPWALHVFSSHRILLIGWAMVLGTAALHGMYVVALARTYSLGDLSQVYPLMRGVSPLVVPLIAVAFLGEPLSWFGWMGVGLIVGGIGLVGGVGDPRRIFLVPTRAVGFALGVGLLITAYTVWDKLALAYVPAVILNSASNLANLIALWWPLYLIGRAAVLQEWRVNWIKIALAGILSPGGYLLFLWALERLPVSQVAPMREVGTVFGTFLGVWLLKEPRGLRRILGASVIMLGVVLLGVLG